MKENSINSNEQDIGLQSCADYHVGKICEHLKLCEFSMRENLAEFIASLCDVDKNEMFSNTDVVYLAHSRWLYWYAYRYMTNESYDKIAMQTSKIGHAFNPRTVQSGVSKMTMIIESEPIWKKRWLIIKKIIKTYNDEDEDEKINPIIIQVPKEFKDYIKINYK